jgi:hypothetical protein
LFLFKKATNSEDMKIRVAPPVDQILLRFSTPYSQSFAAKFRYFSVTAKAVTQTAWELKEKAGRSENVDVVTVHTASAL